MLDFSQAFLRVIEIFENHEIPYMVVGSVAAMIYGEPRLTHDLDVVIDMPLPVARKLASFIPEEEFYCPPQEVIEAEAVQCGQFNLIHHQSGIKVDIVIRKNTAHARTEFARRRKMPFWTADKTAFLASPEDVIIKKLDYFREGGSEKHLKDIRSIIVETPLDTTYLEHWITALHLQHEWSCVQ
jgi:hypothetical protein